MPVSYKKLWHILLDREMKKVDLQRKAGLSKYVVNRMSRNAPVTTDTLEAICRTLGCRVDDILEFTSAEVQQASPHKSIAKTHHE